MSGLDPSVGARHFPAHPGGSLGDAPWSQHNEISDRSLVDGALTDLGAVEAIEIITEAFDRKGVDITIRGDLESVEIDLGLRTERATPAPDLFHDAVAFKDGTSSRRHDPSPEPPFRRTVAPSAPQLRGRVEKVGRNDPCPRGSGKKYKKCCLNGPAEAV